MKTPKTVKPKAKTIAELLEQIRQETDGGDYIFRGESRKYREVSSSLYREYKKAAGVDGFSISKVQSSILESVRKHINEENSNAFLEPFENDRWKNNQIQKKDDAILEELQHYGGKTNQIDFTTDYLIALFFACDAEPEKDGRLIFLDTKKLEGGEEIYKPKNPQHRVIAQKSIFIRPLYKGVVGVDKIIVIDKKLKKLIPPYLKKHHDISRESIYNDIHGFIDRNRNYKDGYTHLYLGVAYYDKGNYEKAIYHYTEALKHDDSFVTYNNRGSAYAGKGDHASAIVDYTKAIELNLGYVNAYISRSLSHGEKGDDISALKDCNEAIRLNPHYARAYDNRGIFYNNKEDYDFAIADYTKAIELDSNYAAAYHHRGVSYNSRSDKGDYALALADFDESIKLNPNDSMAYANRALAKSALHDHKGSEEDFKIASRLTEQGNPSPPTPKRK